jgi:hypothetical protein
MKLVKLLSYLKNEKNLIIVILLKNRHQNHIILKKSKAKTDIFETKFQKIDSTY